MTKLVRPTGRQTGRASGYASNLFTANTVDQSGLGRLEMNFTTKSVGNEGQEMRGLYLLACYTVRTKPLFLYYVETCFQTSNPHVRRILRWPTGVYHYDDGTTTRTDDLSSVPKQVSLSVQIRFL
jgi:hypothetical protein